MASATTTTTTTTSSSPPTDWQTQMDDMRVELATERAARMALEARLDEVAIVAANAGAQANANQHQIIAIQRAERAWVELFNEHQQTCLDGLTHLLADNERLDAITQQHTAELERLKILVQGRLDQLQGNQREFYQRVWTNLENFHTAASALDPGTIAPETGKTAAIGGAAASGAGAAAAAGTTAAIEATTPVFPPAAAIGPVAGSAVGAAVKAGGTAGAKKVDTTLTRNKAARAAHLATQAQFSQAAEAFAWDLTQCFELQLNRVVDRASAAASRNAVLRCWHRVKRKMLRSPGPEAPIDLLAEVVTGWVTDAIHRQHIRDATNLGDQLRGVVYRRRPRRHLGWESTVPTIDGYAWPRSYAFTQPGVVTQHSFWRGAKDKHGPFEQGGFHFCYGGREMVNLRYLRRVRRNP